MTAPLGVCHIANFLAAPEDDHDGYTVTEGPVSLTEKEVLRGTFLGEIRVRCVRDGQEWRGAHETGRDLRRSLYQLQFYNRALTE